MGMAQTDGAGERNVDSFGYTYLLWPPGDKDEAQPGDDVIVSLDKGKVRARVLQEQIKEVGHKFNGRVKYTNTGDEYHVRPARITKVLQCKRNPMVAIVASTDDMRFLARTQVEEGDQVADVGSSFGICTEILAACCNNNVVGLELSSEQIESARKRFPHINFVQMDVLEEPERVMEVCQGRTKIFIDLGGNRSMKFVSGLLPLLQNSVRPDLIVVKNEELAAAAGLQIRECGAASAAAGLVVGGIVPMVESWQKSVLSTTDQRCK